MYSGIIILNEKFSLHLMRGLLFELFSTSSSLLSLKLSAPTPFVVKVGQPLHPSWLKWVSSSFVAELLSSRILTPFVIKMGQPLHPSWLKWVQFEVELIKLSCLNLGIKETQLEANTRLEIRRGRGKLN